MKLSFIILVSSLSMGSLASTTAAPPNILDPADSSAEVVGTLGEYTCAGCAACTNPSKVGDAIGGVQKVWGGSPYLCPQGWKGSCDEMESCDDNFAAAVQSAWESSDSDALLELIASHRNGLFNARRSAVQVLDCSGRVALHLEVSGQMLATLTDADL